MFPERVSRAGVVPRAVARELEVPAVFSTCLFCHESLGRNDAIEPFPVGRRLAFDPKKGRLWVICRSCSR